MEMMKEADSNGDGKIDYAGEYSVSLLSAVFSSHPAEFVKVFADPMHRRSSAKAQ
jgi:hypothetical protein